MANQLDHMTLGMATVFFFSWIADTISAFAGLFAGCDCWPGLAMEAETYAALTPIQIPMYYLNHILLVVVSLLLIGAGGALLVMGARAKHADISAKEKTFYVPLSPGGQLDRSGADRAGCWRDDPFDGVQGRAPADQGRIS